MKVILAMMLCLAGLLGAAMVMALPAFPGMLDLVRQGMAVVVLAVGTVGAATVIVRL